MKKMLRVVFGVLAIFVMSATSLNSAAAAAGSNVATGGTNQPDDGGAGDYGVMN